MHNQQTPPGEAADGIEAQALGLGEPVGADKSSDGTATGADQGNDTTTTTDAGTTAATPADTTAGQQGDEDPVSDLYTELTGELAEEPGTPADAKPAQAAERKPEDANPPPTSDQKPPTTADDDTPPRRHIKNLKKQLEERDEKLKKLTDLDQEHQDVLGAVGRLEEGFKRARIDPAQAIAELETFAKAAEGDPAARQAIASRYGLAPTAPSKAEAPALTDQQRKLLEDYGLADEFSQAGSKPPAAAPVPPTTPAQPVTPAAPAPAAPANPAARQVPQEERVGAEAMATIAAGVRAAEGELAQQILDDAGKRMLAKVETAQKELGIAPSPAKWASLFRTAVGEATAAMRRPTQAPPRGLRPSSGGGTNQPRDSLDEVFEGMLS
jgi:hypothetical protein